MKRLYYADVYTTDTYNNYNYHDIISEIMAEDSKEAAKILRDILSKKVWFDMEHMTKAYKYHYYREVSGEEFLDNIQVDEEDYDSYIYQDIRLYENMECYPCKEDTAIKIIHDLRESKYNKAPKALSLSLGSYYNITFFSNTTKMERYEIHYSLDKNNKLIAKRSRREYMDYHPLAEIRKFSYGDAVHIIYDELNINFFVLEAPKPWYIDENWENMYWVRANDLYEGIPIPVHESELVKVNEGE